MITAEAFDEYKGPAELPDLEVRIRSAVDTDLGYVLHSWQKSWALSADNRRQRPRSYNRDFDDVVRNGIMLEPDTRVLIGCDPGRPTSILCWAVFTPGIPTLHYVYVRAEHPATRGPIRRRGVFAILVAAMGIRDGGDVAYTLRPQEHSHRFSNRRLGVEDALLEAARRHQVVARYQPVMEFLGRGRSHRR